MCFLVWLTVLERDTWSKELVLFFRTYFPRLNGDGWERVQTATSPDLFPAPFVSLVVPSDFGIWNS